MTDPNELMTSLDYERNQTDLRVIILSVFLSVFVLLQFENSACGQANVLGRLQHQGRDFYGRPLSWNGSRMALLDPKGELNLIPMKSKTDFEVVSPKFQPYSSTQMKDWLRTEFGQRYDINSTDRFVVVHPWGSAATYAKPFETMLDRFTNFFVDQGIALQQPETLFVVVVLRSRYDFDRYQLKEIRRQDRRIRGYYSPITNRITTYDPSGRLRGADDNWIFQTSSIIHESTHQFAFNTGLHNRFAAPPKWLSEGLALLFEARGFNDSRRFGEPSDRINRYWLKILRSKLKRRNLRDELINLVANDKLFELDTETAYALAWGLSYFLVENHRESYFEFLQDDARRPNFSAYSETDRMKSFLAAFGYSFEDLDPKLRQFFLGTSPVASGLVP